jgi:hypothetical protein
MARQEHAGSETTPSKKTVTVQPGSDHEPGIESTTTAIHVPKTTWILLRSVAFHRAQANGGRASVSKLITELVERHRAELEKETTHQ